MCLTRWTRCSAALGGARGLTLASARPPGGRRAAEVAARRDPSGRCLARLRNFKLLKRPKMDSGLDKARSHQSEAAGRGAGRRPGQRPGPPPHRPKVSGLGANQRRRRAIINENEVRLGFCGMRGMHKTAGQPFYFRSSRRAATRGDPSGRMSRPEKSLQALEKAQNGLGT